MREMNVKLDYNPSDPLPDLEEGLRRNGIEYYLNAEEQWMPFPGYQENKFSQVWRERALSVIFNVAMRENLEPFIPYLAMNYYDRCVSRDNPLPVVMKHRQNDFELFCICCLTLACKMRDRDFSMIEFQRRHSELVVVAPEKFLIMELYILKGIDWRLRAVTAICFMRFFAPESNLTYSVRRRTINQILINSQHDMKNTRFRPSIMAASAFLAASSLLFPEEFQSLVSKITSQEIFKETDLLNCMKGLIRECKQLNLSIESVVAENEYFPRKKVEGEGEIFEDEDETCSTINIAETTTLLGPSHNREADESSEESISCTPKPEQVNIEGAVEENGESETASIGKEMELAEVPKTGEEMAMGFALRWKLGEKKADAFAIFTDVSNAGKADRRHRWKGSNLVATEDAAVVNPQQRSEVSKLHMLRCFCSCCHSF